MRGVHGGLWTLRAETITRAPILRSFRRSVPAVARARPVPESARRSAAMRMDAKAEKRSRSWLAGKRVAEVRSANRSSCCSLMAFSALPRGSTRVRRRSGGERGLRERGDDEAGVGLARQMLGLGDDAARAGPAPPGGVGELLVDADRAAAAPRLDPGGEEFRRDSPGEPGVAGDADDVVHAVVLAPGQQFLAGVGGVGPHQDAEPGPPAAQPGDDAGERFGRARSGAGVARPEHGAQRVLAAEDVERQEAVVAVVAWKERPSWRPCTLSSVASMSSTSRDGGSRPGQDSMNSSVSSAWSASGSWAIL